MMSSTSQQYLKSTSSQPRLDVKDKCIVVTGGGSGIGAALCIEFARFGASCISIVDMNEHNAHRTAEFCKTKHQSKTFVLVADVSKEDQVANVIQSTEQMFGPIDLFVANAGVYVDEIETDGSWSIPTALEWEQTMNINLLQHLHVIKFMLPRYIQRCKGHFLFTSSAAGLLLHPNSLSYTVSKAGVIAVAEWVSIIIGGQFPDIGVAVLCPQAVNTPMIQQNKIADQHLAIMIMKPSFVAECCIKALLDGNFLVLPHSQVQQYIEKKAHSRDKWIQSMKSLLQKQNRTKPRAADSTAEIFKSKL